MSWKRILLASLVICLVSLLWNGLIHGIVLKEANQALEGLRRDAGPGLLPGLLLTTGIALLFVVSYAIGRYPPGPSGGLLHGVLFALLAGLLVDLNQYLLYPIPATLALSWFGFSLIEFPLYGALAAYILGRRRPHDTLNSKGPGQQPEQHCGGNHG